MTRRPRNASGVFFRLARRPAGLSAPRWRLRLRHPLALGLFSVALLWLIWQIIAGSGWIQPLFAGPCRRCWLLALAGQGFMDATPVATPGCQPVAHRSGSLLAAVAVAPLAWPWASAPALRAACSIH